MKRHLVLAMLAVLAVAASPARSAGPPKEYLTNAQGNQLDLYDIGQPIPALSATTPIPSHSHDPSAAPGADPVGHGNDVNGQLCTVVQNDGSVRYLMGEDSDQGDLPLGVAQGWGLFEATGGVNGPWTLRDKIVAPYRLDDNDHLPDNTGCTMSSDGERLFLVDLGVGAFDVPGVGSLFLVYRDDAGDFSNASEICVLANDLTTAGYAAEHQDGSILVPESGRSSGGSVSRFTPPFPAKGDTAACDAYRASHGVDERPNFIQPLFPLPFNPLAYVPISIVERRGHFLVGNVVPGLIIEVDDEGNMTRPVVLLQGPGVAGMAVSSDGTLYWANLGLIPCMTILCPGPGTGTVWKLPFAPILDLPLLPIPLNIGLAFPEGMGIVQL
ncbi:MAG: hypothetical protein WEB06_11110 [Actinomycetota bacterium]